MSECIYGDSPKEIMQLLARNIKTIRKSRKWSQLKLSEISGVSYATLKKFESTGVVSLESFLKLCRAINRLDEFKGVLKPDDLERKNNLFDID